ncbi:MAG TPA: SBBP repeat-containing protein, partial [Flavisolibacter sp.]|nr:SBBP repeat-containing protein [Flavisolibacter sp.]
MLFTLCFVNLISFCPASFAQLQQQWVKANAAYGHSITLDSTGNVYITENDTDGFLTIKYDSTGKLLWQRSYIPQGNLTHFVRKAVSDDRQNVYLLGSASNDEANYYSIIIKYDRNGNQLKVVRFEMFLFDIAVDQHGNIYYLGEVPDNNSMGSYISIDFYTTKYDSSFNQLWYQTGSATSKSFDSPASLTVDQFGNVYVTGYTTEDAIKRDYLTLKYDASGREIWKRQYHGSVIGSDQAQSVAVDHSGNVYVTGFTQFVQSQYAQNNGLTIKYDSNGNLLWEKWYDGPNEGANFLLSIAVDAKGGVYVAGSSYIRRLYQELLISKYDSAGHRLWDQYYQG